jgi:hypothetical protein
MEDEHPHLEETLESTQIFAASCWICAVTGFAAGWQGVLAGIRATPGAVAIIAELDDGQLLFVRQYRYPLQPFFP